MSSDKSRIYFFEKKEVFLKKIRTGFGVWGWDLGMGFGNGIWEWDLGTGNDCRNVSHTS